MGNYKEGICNERVARGYCREDAVTSECGLTDKCYYHDKIRLGLCDNADDVVIFDDEDIIL